MERKIGLLLMGLAVTGMLGGCVSKMAFDNVKRQVATLETGLASVRKQTDTRLKACETGLASLNKQFGVVEDRTNATRDMMKDLDKDIATLAREFKRIGMSTADTRAVLLKILQGARDMYKRQYESVEEMLEELAAPEPE